MTDSPPQVCAMPELPSAPGERPAWVASALSRQIALYEDLDSLSRRQGDLIEADDTDGLLAVLGQRQGVVEQIVDIGARLEPVRRDWEAFLAGLPRPTREQIAGLVERLSELAGIVAGRDEADRLRLQRRRAEVGEELTAVSRGRSAVAAYAGRSSDGPVFQDREV